jgi:FlaA1/EpsC-like NDP-sugar epimerase
MVQIEPILGSITDAALMRQMMQTYGVQIVLHAAAYKHVPLVERNAIVGVTNNVFGTQTLALAAAEAGVDQFILISSDKAVRPTNAMGASKRLAEIVIQDLANRAPQVGKGKTIFSMVRFGNVIGSSGSVVPLFQEQIRKGGPLTLTHREVTRYFMTIPEASRLVLAAGALAVGGDVFVLDMGDPVPIYDLARRMIEAAGYTPRDAANPHGDIEIVMTGLRPGEKLYEELLIGSESRPTVHPKIVRAHEPQLSEIEVAAVLKAIRLAAADLDVTALRAALSRWVEQIEEAGHVPAATARARLTPRIEPGE